MAVGSMFEVWTWMASFGFLAMLQQFIPREYTDGFRRSIRSWLRRMTPYIYCDFHEYDNSTANKLYQDVQMYLSTVTLEGALRVNMCKSKAARAATFSLANDEGVVDKFDGARLHWVHRVDDRQRPQYFNFYENRSEEKRKFTLRISKKNKERMLDKYVEHIERKAKELTREARDLQLYTNSKGQDYFSRKKRWESVSFLHPANFDTLALDGDLKSKIITDLENFANNEKYYKRVGKAWKRGYLLYGPPGTGKSSMIAAIANKMRYDVYDLELTEVESNAQLRKLLLQTSNKAVIVIEDIDCSLDLSGQRKKAKKKEDPTPPGMPPPKPDEQSKVTLSGLLNFVDGLWSCCGSERIFIFTTNFVEKLDPALLRAGRMDMHIHLSYCTFSAFKVLCKNYLQVEDHDMFEEVEKAFEGTFMTPAEVSEVLIKSQDDKASVALQSLITTLGEHREDPRIKAEAEAAAEAKEAEEEEKKQKEKEQKEEKEKEEKEEKKEKEREEKKKKEKEEKKKKKRDEEKAKAADDANAKSKEEADQKTSAALDETKEMKSKESTKGVRSSEPKIVPVDEADIEPEQNLSDTKVVKESARNTHSSFPSVAAEETATVKTTTNAQEKVEE